jgi:hypothetical protein
MLEVLESGTIIVPVGSGVTCSPPPRDTDEDFLLFVDNMNDAALKLIDIGFSSHMTHEQFEDYKSLMGATGGKFTSLRLGDVNYIVTENPFFFDRFLTATHICKTLNVMEKQHRILIFHAVFGESYLKHIPGMTSKIIDKVYGDIEAKTFEAGVIVSNFEEHVATKLSTLFAPSDGVVDPYTQIVTFPNGMSLTREVVEDNL